MVLVRVVGWDEGPATPPKRRGKVTHILRCRGLTAEEYREIMEVLDGTPSPPARGNEIRRQRNPALPFDPVTIHKIYVFLSKSVLATYGAKKAIDLIVDVLKKKLLKPVDRPKKIEILNPDGEVELVVEVKPPKARQRR